MHVFGKIHFRKKTPRQPPALNDRFVNYWTWNGLLHSYITLKKESSAYQDEQRLKYLRRQIIWHFFKNFFFFPLWLFSLLIPSYMKGDVNVWTNLRALWQTLTSREFRPLRVAVFMQFVFLYVIGHLGYIVFHNYAIPTYAATFTWIQSSWSGGASTTASALHPGNQTGWTRYTSASSTISATTSVALLPIVVSSTHTSDTDFSGGNFSQTEVSGTGSSAKIQLTSEITGMDTWSSPLATPPAAFSGNGMIRINNTFFAANSSNDFASYSITSNTWTSLASIPGELFSPDYGSMLWDGGDYIYLTKVFNSREFYRYSISTDTWTARALLVNSGTVASNAMVRGGDDYIFIIRGQSTSFARYSISADTFTTRTLPPSGSVVRTMIRNGSDNDIYFIGQSGTSRYFFRYSITGNSWATLASLSTLGASALIRSASSNDMYAIGVGRLFRYSIIDNTWTTLALTAGSDGTGLYGDPQNNFLYTKGTTAGNFYRYSISSGQWTTLPDFPTSTGNSTALSVGGPLDSEIYALNPGGLFKFNTVATTYSSPGTYTSSVIDTGGSAGYLNLDYTATTPGGTTLTIDVRAGDTVAPDGTWTSWQTNITDNGSLASLGSRRYVQYRVNLETQNSSYTPSLSDIKFIFNRYTSGSLISSPYNAGDSTNVLGSIAWNATTPVGTIVKFQVRTSPNNSSYTSWLGPDGTSDTYFTDSTGAQDMPAAVGDGVDDQWIQYRAVLESDGAETPVLSGTTFSYVVNAPPEIVIVTSTPISQSVSGVVSVSYQVRDIDTAVGVTPGFVAVELQYCASNCSSVGNEVWETATTSSLSGSYGSAIAIEAEEYIEYSLVWDPVISYNNQYNGADFKIRLRANDSEAANNYGTVESDTFDIDTKDPVVTVGIDGRSDAPYNLTINVVDDTSAGLQMKLSNDSDLTSDGLNGSSGTWIPYTATSTWDFPPGGTTIYYQVRDVYGNVSANGAIASAQTPAVPDQIVYRDVSNADTSEWREFIAWGIIADPVPGFEHYTVWRSTDGTNYTELDTESDRLINYYLDDNLDTETTYYYKVTAEDADGNVSNYSNIVNDKPNGQGGSDVTPPTVSNVSSTPLGPQSVMITWDTDELSDSLVDYTIEQGGDFSNVDTVGLTAMYDNSLGLGQHSVVLTDLEPNTTYYFRVRSNDLSANEGIGTEDPDGYSFTTPLGPSISQVGASEITNEVVTINWTTDQASNSYVHYSSNSSFTSSTRVGLEETVSEHSVILSNLTQGTTYYYYVESGIATDKNVVEGEIIYYTFTTTADVDAPVITFDSEADVTVSDDSINFSWVTNEAATSTIEYGTSEEYGVVIVNNNLNVDHIYTLDDLLPGTLYYIRFRSADENGNMSSATEFEATTIDTADYDDPVISGVVATVVTDDDALIEWDTDEATTGQVYYGISTSIYSETSEFVSSYNRAHAITLSGLSTSTQYYYIVVSSDSSGNTATSSEYSFTTLETLSEESEVLLREEAARAEGVIAGEAASTPRSGGGGGNSTDRRAPVLSNVEVTDIGAESVVISWASDEIGDSIVEFGLTTEYIRAAVNLEDTATHRISVVDLDPETTYTYRVSSADPSGNRSQFIGGTFTTLSTLEEITDISEEIPEVTGEDADNLFVASIEKAANIIRALSSQVSVGVLESSLLRQTEVIEELSTLLPLPIIGGQPLVETGSNYAAISWTTDKLSNSLVEYAPGDEYLLTNAYAQTVGNFNVSTNAHTVEVRGLRPNTLYHYRVISRTPTGAETTSRDFTFRTKTEFSEISNYKTQVLSPQEASFFWTTNLPTNSAISYTPYRLGSPDTGATKVARQAEYTTEHLIVLSDLEAGVLYDIEFSGVDFGGNTVSKLLKGFTTDGTDIPPIIYQIQTDSAIIPGGKEKIQVIISWVTNELATSRVLYRKGFASDDTPFTDSTVADLEYVKKHIVVVSNFDSGQVYQFAVESTDSGGNTAVSKTITILTPRKEQSVFQVIFSNVEDMFSWTGKLRR